MYEGGSFAGMIRPLFTTIIFLKTIDLYICTQSAIKRFDDGKD